MKNFNYYKVGFFIALALCIASWTLMFFSASFKNELAPASYEISRITTEKSELQNNFDKTIVRLDSVLDKNNMLMSKLKIKSPNDSMITSLTETQKRRLRLIDSIYAVQDSISRVATGIIALAGAKDVTPDQLQLLRTSFDKLGSINLALNFTIDEASLTYLRTNTDALKALVGRFDTRVQKLDRISKTLERFSKYLQVAIDVFAGAISQGIIVSKQGSGVAGN